MGWRLLSSGLLSVLACEQEPECGRDVDESCPQGFICIADQGVGVCAQVCQGDGDCTEGGSCEDCLASGDCPECDVCVSACF
jgi:hypothetical protein